MTERSSPDIELLPCPFCGGAAYVFEKEGQRPDESVFRVHCDGCEATHTTYRDHAIAAWNLRATQPAASAGEEVYKALDEAREELCKTTHHLTLGYKLDGFDYAVEAVETVLLAPTAMAQSDEGEKRLSAGIEDTKTVYVKRWRTLVKLPTKYADEIVEALRDAAQPQQEPVAWEDMPETRRLLKTITAGVECSIDGNLATVFISDESDPSVGLDGGLRLSLSCNYEVIPLSFLNDIKRAMGDNWERSLDLWRQIHEPSAISSTKSETSK